MDTRHKISTILRPLTFILLCIVIIITTIDLCCFDRDFYTEEYIKSDTASVIKTSEENLEKMTDVVLEYLKDKDKTMDLRLMVNGKVQEVFSVRAKTHMIDVRNLYLNALEIRNIALVMLTVCVIGMALLKEKPAELLKSYISVLKWMGFIFTGIGVFALVDFNTFWIGFHKLLFTNDLWLLDYDDVLVNMVNETFFFDLVIKIVVIILLSFILIYSLLYIGKRVIKYED